MSEVFGIDFTTRDLRSLVALFSREPVAAGSGLKMVVTANIDHVANLLRNAQFRQAYSSASVVTADGVPVTLYARLRGAGLPGRIAGPDLFANLMSALESGAHRPFFVVSRNETGQRLRDYLVGGRGFADNAVGVVCPSFGFEKDRAYSAGLARRIHDHGTTHLFMGVGSPKSELWLYDWAGALGDCYAFGLGAGIDYFVGTETRAPQWMQRLCLEWFWRVACEPRRLARRYLVDALLFPVAVVRDLTGHWAIAQPASDLPGGPTHSQRAS